MRGWLLSNLLVLLTSLSYIILLLLQLHCRKPRPALVPLTSAPLTRPSRASRRWMETPSLLLGVHWLVPPLILCRLLGLTTRRPSISRPPIFILIFSVLPVTTFFLMLWLLLLTYGGLFLFLGPHISLTWPT